MHIGGCVVLLKQGHESQYVSRIRRHIGFLDLGSEIRRRPQVEGERNILRQVVRSVTLLVIAIELAHLFCGRGSGRRFAGFNEVGSNFHANGRRRLQFLIVSADVHGSHHAEQRLTHVERGLGLRPGGAGKRRQHQRQDKPTAKTAQKSLLKRLRRESAIYSLRAEYGRANRRAARPWRSRKPKNQAPYPLTCTFENDRITRLAVGCPKAVAGWKVVKISMFFSCGRMAASFSGADRMR